MTKLFVACSFEEKNRFNYLKIMQFNNKSIRVEFVFENNGFNLISLADILNYIGYRNIFTEKSDYDALF